MTLSVAIVGRPNVGKSTLFNRLVGKRLALVDDQPGVTRDLREGDARLGDLRFTVIDTAGLEEATDESLPGRMRKLTTRAVEMADVCIFVIDARVGVTRDDQVFAEILRRQADGRVVLAANKSEGSAADAGLYEAYSLGLGEPVPLSAEHGEGMEALFQALRPYHDAHEEALKAEVAALEAEDEAVEGKALQIAVVGRPNAGKSTLINAILGEDRLLTGPEAGITRDAIGLDLTWGDRAVKLFDTAGMRKRAKVQDKLEKLSVSDGLRAVRFAEVVIVLMDVTKPFETQDLRIADLAEREGRAVVFAVNKWDLAAERDGLLPRLIEERDRLLPQLSGAPLITLSAITGRGLQRLAQAVFEIHGLWNTRLPTAKLNTWLEAQTSAHPPPAPSGRRIRLRYITQAKARPPTFVLFSSRPDALPASYTRYLVNGLRRDFDLPGVPIRLELRKPKNPYEGKKGRKIY
ncbi:MAG: ribosome biogenesis GTPase Der [Pseudomonadota bacterium]